MARTDLAGTAVPLRDGRVRILATRVFAEHERYLKEHTPKAGVKVKEELRRITGARDRGKVNGTLESSGKDNLSLLLDGMSLEDVAAYASSQTKALHAAHTDLEKKRSKGLHNATSRTQSFITEFDRFLSAYSGVVNIVALADAQYGGVAGATLALLFSAVQMKAKNDEAITAAMAQMSDRLPDLQIYRKIYPDPILADMLLNAYKDVIMLAREAISFYLSSTWALLAQQVDHLTQEIDSLQKRMDNDTIMETKRALQLDDYYTEEATESLKRYRNVLASIFDNDRHREKLCVEDFLAHEVGHGWQENRSHLVVLSGRNETGVSSPMSWLSPMVVDLALSLLSEGQRVLFAKCDESSTLETVLSRLVFQLLEQNPAAVRKVEEWYKIQKLISRRDEDRTDAISEALQRVVGLQQNPVFVILDRPELSDDSTSSFAATMLRLVEQTDGVLKVLMVHRAELWDWEANKRAVLGRGTDAESCRALRLDQRRSLYHFRRVAILQNTKMAFRKRNIALSRAPAGEDAPSAPSPPSVAAPAPTPPGVRPSPIDGRPTTSTGTPSLDGILAGHAGLALGHSILIGESGTTDYSGALLRFYAAEGVVQGHKVHVVGMGEFWGRELPGISEDKSDKRKEGKERAEKMKIAWRTAGQGDGSTEEQAVFCHTFDLAKRLTLPVGTAINYVPIPSTTTATSASPFASILQKIRQQLASTPAHTIHRIVVPSLLSPALYPSSSAHPTAILQFLHALRALLRQYPTRLTAIITLPLTLYPRSSGLVRWMEILSDGVFELSPFPYSRMQALAQSAGTTKDEERPQGMFAVHKLPVFHEKGGGGGAEDLGEDMAFTLSRRKFVIAKFSLPPMEGDTEAQEEAVREAAGASAMPKKQDLEF
ncbi:paxneb protein superfamily [Stemphylium lycopersici]|uniref:Elongator complex protein 4 n=1 Tax=Stemphylium lycopersici TaxID=183478 RepID=A0A364NDB0_STELY|nr:paxneb protein superfamily [Stemphylium lycopersici]RAR15197.1 paxneb superfamily protein-like protein [Stemphylium lycopersici]